MCKRVFNGEIIRYGIFMDGWISTKKKGVSCDVHLMPFCSISGAKHGLVLDPLYH